MGLLLFMAVVIAVACWLNRLQREEDSDPEAYAKRLETRLWPEPPKK